MTTEPTGGSPLQPDERQSPAPARGRPIQVRLQRRGGDEDGEPPVHLELPVSPGNTALAGLLVLASFYTLHFARSFLIPLVLAFLLSLLLAPLVRALSKVGLPTPLAAAVVLGLALGGFGFATYNLAGPASEWLEQAPTTLRSVERQIRELQRPVERVKAATDQVERMTTMEDESEPPPQQVQVVGTGLSDSLFQLTVGLVATTLLVVTILYALLASGDLLLRKVVALIPRFSDKRRAVLIARRTEHEVSRYLLTVTTINVCLGLTVGVAMYLYELPNPFLWGAMAGTFNFVPVLGAAVSAAVIALVAASTFTETTWVLLPPATFVVLTSFEAYLITPHVLSRRFSLNLVAIFVALFFWSWLWGIAGVLLAVPMLATLKILSDQISMLAPVGRLLGR